MFTKRIWAAVLTVAMAAALFTGCGKNYEKVVEINDTPIAPNLYLCAQYQAYSNALNEVGEDVTDILAATIEETPAKEWIHNETMKILSEYVWVEETFEELGLTLSEDDQAYIDYQVEYYWPYLEESYTDNGIGLETHKKFLTFSYKYDMLFKELFGEESENAPSDEEAKAYMNENYARVSGFYLQNQGYLGGELSENGILTMEGYCDEAVKELNEGADLESVCKKYRSFAVQTLKLEEEDYTDMSVYTADMYVGETSTVMGEEDVAKLFEMEENGSYSYCNTPNGYLVFRRIPNFEKESEYTNLKSTIVAEMNEDVYTAYVDEIVSAYNYLEDLEAVDYYSVEKIK